jgi:hypothetical protein
MQQVMARHGKNKQCRRVPAHQAGIQRRGPKPASSKDCFGLVIPVVIGGPGTGREGSSVALNCLGYRLIGSRKFGWHGSAVELRQRFTNGARQIWRSLPTRKQGLFKCGQCRKRWQISHGSDAVRALEHVAFTWVHATRSSAVSVQLLAPEQP